MKFTYTLKDGIYTYKGPRGHGGIAYSLEEINRRLTNFFGADNFSLEPA
ncbi:hypothetical protein [Pseudomonas sp.]|nr:hypothetical protein [Pseudomonas sp.]